LNSYRVLYGEHGWLPKWASLRIFYADFRADRSSLWL
jgi:hypothetical protein